MKASVVAQGLSAPLGAMVCDGGVNTIVPILCLVPPHSNSFQPIPAKVLVCSNSWFSLGPVSLSKLEEGRRNAFLNRCS